MIHPQSTENWTGTSLVEQRKSFLLSALSFFFHLALSFSIFLVLKCDFSIYEALEDRYTGPGPKIHYIYEQNKKKC